MPRRPRSARPRPRFSLAVAVLTTLSLAVTLLTPSPVTAAPLRDAFPKPPTAPPVAGSLAQAEGAASAVASEATTVAEGLASRTYSVPIRATTDPQAVGDTGITLQSSRVSSSGEVELAVLGEARRAELGNVDLAFEITPRQLADGVRITIPDSVTEGVFGAGYATRVHWAVEPVGKPAREERAPAASRDYTTDQTTLSVPANQRTLVTATSSTTSADGSGTFSATPLSAANSWDVSAQTGAFAWSYPIPLPPAPAGETPAVSIEYNSQIVDGATSSTNNQPSAIGEGWDLSGSGFIQRRYVACAQEQSPGTPVAGSTDLCWATDNATISFGGHSGSLVRDANTGAWKLQNDDNSRIEKLQGTAQGCAANGTYNTECWRLTTTDGTQYFFGLNRLPGWSSGKPTTNSAWTVPVFGNDAGDPCKAATFATSYCQQGWRWNLDYVVDVHGNAQAFYYAAETNKYRVNDSTPSSYTRGGQLLSIEYGLKSSTVYASSAATGRVLFGYDAKGRCNPANAADCSTVALGGDTATPATPGVYPDVPFDLNCISGACTGQRAPSFWTTARLATITTQVWTGGQYKNADQYTLNHSFPDPGDGQDAALWLESVQHTATAGASAIAENPTSFAKTPLQNRVWVKDGLAPLDKFRIASITQPTGARLSVNYSSEECTPAMAPTILSAPWANDKRCYPQWWTPELDIPSTASQHLFHKYVVVSTIEDPYTGGGASQPIRTSYEYTGKPAWRYADDRLVASDRRTWSDYAGYDKVEVRTGDPSQPSTQEVKQYLFYRGLNGDRAGASGGVKSVNVTGTAVSDDRWFAGQVRSVKTLNGIAGPVVSETMTTPWASSVTASDGVRSARTIAIAQTDTTVPISTGGTRTTSSINSLSARGFVVSTSAEGGVGQQSTCTTTLYAAENSAVWIMGLPASRTMYSVPCSQVATAAVPSTVVSHQETAYDSLAVGAAPTRGLPTSLWEAKAFGGTTLSTAQLVRTSLFTYDSMGRLTSSTDAGNRKTATSYSPSESAGPGSGPLATTTTTNPLGWTRSVTIDPYRGLPSTSTDENNKVTTTERDALGRLVRAWATDRPKAANPDSPSVSFEYGVFADRPSFIKTRSLTSSGTFDTFELFDGLGRRVQSQTPVIGGGAAISDVEYDPAGRNWATNETYWAPTVTPGTALFVPAALNQIGKRTETVFDGAGRTVATLTRSFGSEIRRESTIYRGGDRVDTVPPTGGIPTSTYMDAWGRTSKVTQWLGAIDATGVETSSLQYEYNARAQMVRMRDEVSNVWTWTFDLRGRQIGTTDPDAGAKSLAYDDIGNLTTTTDARSVTTGFTYDALDRKTSSRDGGTTGTVLSSWTYDTLAKGQLTSSSTFSGGLEYKNQMTGYDGAYRPTGSRLSIPAGAPAFAGTTYNSSTYYNQDGTVAATTVPAVGGLPAEDLYFSYDVLGRQSGLSGAASYASGVTYLASGEVGQIIRPGTTWSALTFGYDPGTRELTTLEETTRRGSTFTQEAYRQYARNGAGIITRASTTADTHSADVQCFRYNGLQALTDAWTPAAGNCATGPTASRGGPAPYRVGYTIDADTGNRTTATTWSGSTPTVTTFAYGAAGSPRPHALQQTSRATGSASPQTTVYSHDPNGAMTAQGAQSMTYDAAGRLATVTTGSTTERSLYAADGALLMKWGGSDGASLYIGSTVLRNVSGATTGIRSYAVAGVTIAERVSGSSGGLWWQSPDPVGTVGLQIAVSTGTVTRRWLDPFGVNRGPNASWSSPLGYLNAPRSATGLTQLGARAYAAELGRFITVDPVLNASEPRHANAYTYGYHSPVSNSDPTGLEPRPIHKGITPGIGSRPSASVTPPAAGNKPTGSSAGGGLGCVVSYLPCDVASKRPTAGTSSHPPAYGASCGMSYNACGARTPTAEQRAAGARIGSGVAHGVLTVAGLVPGIGEIADGTDALFCLAEGDPLCAGLSAASMIPIAGWGAAGGKFVKIGDKLFEAMPSPPIKPGSAGGPTGGTPFSQGTRQQALDADPSQTCVYCLMPTDRAQVDHSIPKSRGGDATLENAQIACPHCNGSKGARDFPVTPPAGYTGPWPPPHWGVQP